MLFIPRFSSLALNFWGKIIVSFAHSFQKLATKRKMLQYYRPSIWACFFWSGMSIDPYSRGGVNIGWKMRPNPESVSHLMGWKDLEGFRILRPDDSHPGDRFGRTVVLRGGYLVVGAGEFRG